MFDPHCTILSHTCIPLFVLMYSLVYPCFLTLVCVSVCACICVCVCVCLCVCTCHPCLDSCGSRCSPLQDRGDCSGQRWCRHFRWPYDSGSHATGEPAPTSRPSSDRSWPIKGNEWLTQAWEFTIKFNAAHYPDIFTIPYSHNICHPTSWVGGWGWWR